MDMNDIILVRIAFEGVKELEDLYQNVTVHIPLLARNTLLLMHYLDCR